MGSVSSQLQEAGQWLDLGAIHLPVGTQLVTLALALPTLQPGSGGAGYPSRLAGSLNLQRQRLIVASTRARSTSLAGELSEAADECSVGDVGEDVDERGLQAVVEHQEAGWLEQRERVCAGVR